MKVATIHTNTLDELQFLHKLSWEEVINDLIRGAPELEEIVIKIDKKEKK